MTLASIVWFILVPLVLLIAVVDVLSQSPAQRVKRLRRAGFSQQSIADRCGISRYKVRRILSA